MILYVCLRQHPGNFAFGSPEDESFSRPMAQDFKSFCICGREMFPVAVSQVVRVSDPEGAGIDTQEMPAIVLPVKKEVA